MSETAYAKINLALHVREKRSDGFHAIETMFAFCADGDVVSVEPADELTLSIDGPFAAQLSVTDNLVLRAARMLDEGRGAAIRLTKNLPVASGIGGGSADAAATLRLLAIVWNSDRDLFQIASQIGSDVPACLASVSLRGTGRGDVLAPSDDCVISGMPILLVHPGVAISTAQIFAAWDGVDRGELENWQTGRNDLQPAAEARVPEITALIAWLGSRDGATVARMSGSGATCFALFESIADRDRASRAAQEEFPGYWTVASVLR